MSNLDLGTTFVERVREMGRAIAVAKDAEALATMLGWLEFDADGALWFQGVPLADLPPQLRIDVRAFLLAVADRMAKMRDAIDESIRVTMLIEGASTIYHPDYEVTFESPKPKPTRNEELLYNSLTKLAKEGIADPALVAKAVSMDVETTYSSHLTYVKKLAEAGGKIKAAIDAAIRDDAKPGPKVLKITGKKK